jgi:transcriptional regulator with XRE-family HTH domain
MALGEDDAMDEIPEDGSDPLSDPPVPRLMRQAIAAAGTTQSELARRTGITRDAVSRYCTGRTPIPDGKLVIISDALGVRPSSINPDKTALDGIPSRGEGDPEFLIRPSVDHTRPGTVRLEIAADLDIEVAARIVALITKKMTGNDE